MGYYTTYNLNIEIQNATKGTKNLNIWPDIISDLRESNENAKYALSDDGDTSESCKWYSHESDIINFSIKYPDYLFILSGEGEESGDIWKKYFKNGMSQICKARVIFDEFNESKMISAYRDKQINKII